MKKKCAAPPPIPPSAERRTRLAPSSLRLTGMAQGRRRVGATAHLTTNARETETMNTRHRRPRHDS